MSDIKTFIYLERLLLTVVSIFFFVIRSSLVCKKYPFLMPLNRPRVYQPETTNPTDDQLCKLDQWPYFAEGWDFPLFSVPLLSRWNNEWIELRCTCVQTCIRCLEKLVVWEGVWQMNGLQGFAETPAEECVVIDVHVVDVVTGVHLWNLFNQVKHLPFNRSLTDNYLEHSPISI